MRLARLFALLAFTLLGACASVEEQRAMDETRCRGYGFRKGTDGFAKCLLDVDLDRSATRRADLRSFGPGPGFYGPRYRYWW